MADYDRIGSSDPIGKVLLGYNRKGLEIKHWKEMIENPRRPIVHWHVLKVNKCIELITFPLFQNTFCKSILILHGKFSLKQRATTFLLCGLVVVIPFCNL